MNTTREGNARRPSPGAKAARANPRLQIRALSPAVEVVGLDLRQPGEGGSDPLSRC